MTNVPNIAFISDLHLSRDRPFFQFNWEIMVEELHRVSPGLVLVGGDLTLDGVGTPSDLEYARQQLDRAPCPWLAVPGNHDVGDLVSVHAEANRITDERRAHWCQTIGPDFWLRDVGAWRIVGINSMILGSGMEAERYQAQFIEDAIADANGQGVILLSHMAVCDNHPNDVDMTGWFMPPEGLALMKRHLQSQNVRLMLCGDMHQSRDRDIEGVRHVWCSSVAFVTDIADEWRPKFGGRKRVGWTQIDLADDPLVFMHEPKKMVNFDIGNWVDGGPQLYYQFAREYQFRGFSGLAYPVAR